MIPITESYFDPKEEDVLLKLSMPKRELRPETAVKMQRLKEREKQATLVQPSSPQAAEPLPPPQPQPHYNPHPLPAPLHQPSIIPPSPIQPTLPEEPLQEEQSNESEQTTITQEEPEPVRPVVYDEPQRAEPLRDSTLPAAPFGNVDMFRIEDLTRRIMYRDPQKNKVPKNYKRCES